MKIGIKNFGLIKKANISLDKRFYVFVGYNNTGKTYLSQILWSLYDKDVNKEFIKQHKYNELAQGTTDYELQPELVSTILKDFSKYFTNTALPKIFNISKDHFLLKNTEIEFQYNFKDFLKKDVEVTSGITKILKGKSEDSKLNIELYRIHKPKGSLIISYSRIKHEKIELDKLVPESVINEESDVHNSLLDFILRLCLGKLYSGFYLPASRLFYPVFYQYIHRVEKEKREEMSRKLLAYIEGTSEGPFELDSLISYSSPYTKPMNVLFSKLYRINENASFTTEYEDILNGLKELIGGDIFIKKSEGISPIEFGLNIESDKKLDMYLTSSSVNQLTSLYLYFKYWVSKRLNFLLMDEPEENLHPDNQIKLIDLLMQFANRDNRVLITTHSPLVAETINNYLNICYLIENKRTAIIDSISNKRIFNLKNKDILKKEDFGIYFFSGADVIEYDAKDYGIYFADFDKSRVFLKNQSEIITDEIYLMLKQNNESRRNKKSNNSKSK